jgi:pre-rRNA-processing protein TSR3
MFYEVVIDSPETANKCTIAPLSDRSDFHLFRVAGSGIFGPLRSSVLLHHEGLCLSKVRESIGAVQGVASIDCVWRRLDDLMRRIEGPLPVLVRIPDGFETAYPRRNKKDLDPTGGLATIEAIFVAAAILGNWDVSLLSKYYFGRQFIELNKNRFLELGLHQIAQPGAWPVLPQLSRNSLQRRRDRGRLIN